MRNAWKWILASGALLAAAGLAGCAAPEEATDDRTDVDVGPGEQPGVEEPGEDNMTTPTGDLDPGAGSMPGEAEPGEPDVGMPG